MYCLTALIEYRVML